MAVLSITEVINLIIITVVLGYIFSGFIHRPGDQRSFTWRSLLFAAIVAAPAVIFHELGHKLVAIALGLTATFHIFWAGLALGVILRLFSAPFLILAPAYVSFSQSASALASTLIAVAGPGMNLVLWLTSMTVLRYKKELTTKETMGWMISKKLNFFLFWFNLLPIPPFDGWHVLTGIITLF